MTVTQLSNTPNQARTHAESQPKAQARHEFDVVIVGAGAAGLFCAGVAGQLGLKVLVLDHSERVAEKVRIAGGGRCNFTNIAMDVRAPAKHFISENPKFCRSALSRYTPQHFVDLVNRHGIAWHEKHKGQLFCDHSSEQIIALLLAECTAGGVERWQPCEVLAVRKLGAPSQPGLPSEAANSSVDATQAAESPKTGFFAAGATQNTVLPSKLPVCPISAPLYCYEINSNVGAIVCRNLVVATGGLSIPKIGATDWGYRLAQQMGHRIVPTRPALVPLTFDAQAWQPFAELSGLSLPVGIATGGKKQSTSFDEDLLFTHRGLSGPGVLQISSYWQSGAALTIDLAPHADVLAALLEAKASSKKRIANVLTQWFPQRLADAWVAANPAWQRPINEATDKSLQQLADAIGQWRITPNGSEGYKKAEVTAGGVDTTEMSSQTMESLKSPGLYFIGEVVDVTGWLGGYNFQWAWASAFACAHGMASPKA